MTKLKKQPDAGLPAKRGPAFLLLATGTALLLITLNHVINTIASKSIGNGSASADQTSSGLSGQISHAPVNHNPEQSILETLPAVAPQGQNVHLLEIIGQIQCEHNPAAREDLAALFIAGLAVHNIPATLESLQIVEPTDLAMDLTQRALRRWVECAAPAAVQWISALPEGELRRVALLQVAEVWPNTSLERARSWAASLANETERQDALIAVANEAVRLDPLVALQLVAGFPPSTQRDELICRAATEWAATDTDSALRWARQISDASLRSRVLASEIISWADQDPRAAATFTAQEFAAGRLLDDLVISIVQRWAQQDPIAASDWVTLFPEGQIRATAMATFPRHGRDRAQPYTLHRKTIRAGF